jgi:hypothetical protein
VWRYLRLIELAEVKKPTGNAKRCFAHRFHDHISDTFVIEMLLVGVRPERVTILGHKSCEDHYSRRGDAMSQSATR